MGGVDIFTIWATAFIAMCGITGLLWLLTKPGEALPLIPISRYSLHVLFIPRWFFAGGYQLGMFAWAVWTNRGRGSGDVGLNVVAAVFFVGLYGVNLALALYAGRGVRLEKRPPPANLSGD